MRGRVIRSEFDQNSSATICARCEDLPTSPFAAGTPYLTSAIASIQCTVTVGGTQTWSSSLTPSAVWFDTLQCWPRDSRGYNFRHSLPPAAMPTAPAEATVVYVVTLSDGYVFTFEAVGPVRAIP
jgi:hypothetical protein